jgi:DNA polymerase
VVQLREDIRRVLEDQLVLGGSFVPFQIEDGEARSSETSERTGQRPHEMDVSGNDQANAPFARILSLIPPDSPLHTFNSIDQIVEYVAGTILVPIDETRLNPVPGVGNHDADLMVIGEAPGADEDKKGEPFVGRAGQLLDKILAAIDFARSDVYIANILKSRPPRNRDPEPQEIEAHLPILLRQITIVKPKLILCVGRVPGNVLLKQKTTLKALRQGNFHDYYGIPLMVTYHPAALLRSAQYKRPTWEDVQMLRDRYDELVSHG